MIMSIEEVAAIAKESTIVCDITPHQVDLLKDVDNAITCIDETFQEEVDMIKTGDLEKIRDFYRDYPVERLEYIMRLKHDLEFNRNSIITATAEYFAAGYGDDRIVGIITAFADLAITTRAVDVRLCSEYKTAVIFHKLNSIIFTIIGTEDCVIIIYDDYKSIVINKRFLDAVAEGSIELDDSTQTARYLKSVVEDVVGRESTDDSNEDCHGCEFFNTGTQECDKYLLEKCNTPSGVPAFPLKENCSFTKQRGADYCAQCFYNECGVCVRVH